MCLFVLFAGVAFFKAASGAASCGCFGTVEVNPWYTVGLDLSILGGLLWWRPTESQSGDGTTVSTGDLRIRLAGVLLAWLCLGIGSGVAMASYRTTRLGDVGELLADGRAVVLDPETWVGKRFPLLDWIETEATVDQGRWTVVLYRPGCPACQDLLARYRASRVGSHAANVAIIEVSGVESVQDEWGSAAPKFSLGRLNRQYDWLVRTPIQLDLQDGDVAVVTGEKTLSSAVSLFDAAPY